MKGQRSITDEQILYALLQERQKQLESLIGEMNVEPLESRILGQFTYFDKEKGEYRTSKVFKICELHNGKKVMTFHDEKWRFIARYEDEILKVSDRIDLNQKEFMEFADLSQRNNHQEDGGSPKGGEGILHNFRGEINVYEQTRLDQLINGHELWLVLDLENKLRGRLPAGILPQEAKSGFLARANSSDLNRADGGNRTTEDSFVLRTVNGDIIELGEDIIQPVELGTRAERQRAEDNRMREGTDGKQQEKPNKKLELTRTTMYRIPDVNTRFNVAENWFLAVDKNRESIHSETPYAGHHKEISFVQVSRNESYYDREQRPNKTVETKLKPLNEPEQEGGAKSQQALAYKDPNEAENTRNAYINGIVEECCERFPEYKSYFNKSDIISKVTKYQEDGLDEDEIVEEVGKDIQRATECEHEYPDLGAYPKIRKN